MLFLIDFFFPFSWFFYFEFSFLHEPGFYLPNYISMFMENTVSISFLNLEIFLVFSGSLNSVAQVISQPWGGNNAPHPIHSKSVQNEDDFNKHAPGRPFDDDDYGKPVYATRPQVDNSSQQVHPIFIIFIENFIPSPKKTDIE